MDLQLQLANEQKRLAECKANIQQFKHKFFNKRPNTIKCAQVANF